jgi:tRNA synthetases class I (E and Q), catalytic domain
VTVTAAAQVTHVLRAEEHLPNTLRQLLIYEALGFTPPKFGHMSLILAPDKSKLSKRHGATSVGEFREQARAACSLFILDVPVTGRNWGPCWPAAPRGTLATTACPASGPPGKAAPCSCIPISRSAKQTCVDARLATC